MPKILTITSSQPMQSPELTITLLSVSVEETAPLPGEMAQMGTNVVLQLERMNQKKEVSLYLASDGSSSPLTWDEYSLKVISVSGFEEVTLSVEKNP